MKSICQAHRTTYLETGVQIVQNVARSKVPAVKELELVIASGEIRRSVRRRCTGAASHLLFWDLRQFITLIWYLDRIAETEDLSEFKQTEANREGDPQEPVTKRQKTSRGRARQPQAIKNFYLAWKHANDRPPNVPPPDGTVRKTWLERYLEKTGDQLETKPAPQFWAEWKPDVSLLSAAQQELLRDVPSEDEDAEIEQEEQNAM